MDGTALALAAQPSASQVVDVGEIFAHLLATYIAPGVGMILVGVISFAAKAFLKKFDELIKQSSEMSAKLSVMDDKFIEMRADIERALLLAENLKDVERQVEKMSSMVAALHARHDKSEVFITTTRDRLHWIANKIIVMKMKGEASGWKFDGESWSFPRDSQ